MTSEYLDIASTKYKAIQQRSFDTRLELFLFQGILKSRIPLEAEVSQFLFFKPTDSLIDQLENAWQKDEIETESGLLRTTLIDSEIIKWHTEKGPLKRSLSIAYHRHFEDSVLSFDQFKKVFPDDPRKRICHYTGLSDFDFDELRKIGGIKTKNARGRYMEIDRLNSNREYYADNIVLCCYWANNAKTDEFTYPEFLNYVGPAMKKVFRERMKAG